MKRIFILLPIIAISFATSHAQDSLSFRQMTFKAKVFDVTRKSGYLSAFSDSNIFISEVPISFSPVSNIKNVDRQIAYHELREIVIRRKGSTGRGFLIGSISGAAFGALLGFASGDDPACKPQPNDFLGLGYGLCNAFRTTAEQKAAGGGVFFGLTGGIVGAIVGSISKKFIIGGNRENFNSFRSHMVKKVSRNKST